MITNESDVVSHSRNNVHVISGPAIAEYIKVMKEGFVDVDDSLRAEWEKHRVEIDVKFTELTLNLINRENERLTQVDTAIWWTNLVEYVAAIVAHLFLVLGFVLGFAELRRAYALRRLGDHESVEIQIGAEQAAIKSTMCLRIPQNLLAQQFAFVNAPTKQREWPIADPSSLAREQCEESVRRDNSPPARSGRHGSSLEGVRGDQCHR